MKKETEKKKGIASTLKAMEVGDVVTFPAAQYNTVSSTVSRLNSHYIEGCRWSTQFLARATHVTVTRVS